MDHGIRKERKMAIIRVESEFPHFVASRNEIQSLPLSAVKIAGSGERAYSSSRSKGTRGLAKGEM